jgi:hypothetical protein
MDPGKGQHGYNCAKTDYLSNMECDVGLYCASVTDNPDPDHYESHAECLPMMKLGDKCSTFHGCPMGTECFNYKCKAYYSLKDGASLSQSTSDRYMCKSGSAIDHHSSMEGSWAWCTSAPKSLNEPTEPVDFEHECEYTDYVNYRRPTEGSV